VTTRRRLWRYVYHVPVSSGDVQIVQFRFENDRALLQPVAVLGRPRRRRRRHGVVVTGDGRRRPPSSRAEVVRILDGVLRRLAADVGPLRQRGDARPEVVYAGVEAAQLAARAEAEPGDEADRQRNDHAQNDDCRYCTTSVQANITAFQRLLVTWIYMYHCHTQDTVLQA